MIELGDIRLPEQEIKATVGEPIGVFSGIMAGAAFGFGAFLALLTVATGVLVWRDTKRKKR
jgi:sulfite exporter TauE/SafE